jgi:hypothetical protein
MKIRRDFAENCHLFFALGCTGSLDFAVAFARLCSGGLGVATFHQKPHISVRDNIRARPAGSPMTWIAPGELDIGSRLLACCFRQTMFLSTIHPDLPVCPSFSEAI